ncbi:MAG: pyruvate formate lyase family protein [Eubacteriales bacterium]
MNQIAELFYRIGEPYAAGLFEEPDKGFFYRHALANARFLEHLRPAPYEPGERLYPSKNKYYDYDCAVLPQFALTYQVDWGKLERKSPEAAAAMREFEKLSHSPGGWTHAAPNYKRILREGLTSYRDRVERQPEGEFRSGLLCLLDGMENYIQRSVAYLTSVNAPRDLIDALSHVPFEPAATYYEGLVAWNVIFYFDGADNLGCLDDGLAHLYKGEDYTEIIGELFGNLDAAGTWSCTVGPNYNAITEQALLAIKNRRRPMLELRTRPDMPDRLWQIAIDNIRCGSCNPSFYSEQGIYRMLKNRFPHIPDDELAMFCGCGCTETNLQGLTRAGGTDDNIPLLLILEQYMHQHLTSAATFEEFYEGLCAETERQIDVQLDAIVERYDYMAKYLPNPIRTLFTDDCIENGKDFNAGGARYTWTQSSDSGLVNVIDSLLAIRELVFRQKRFTAEEFLEKLTAEDPVFYQILRQCPCFGTDNDDADALAADYAKRVYMVYRSKPPKSFVDAYILTEHQFLRYESEGLRVGATPDGRKKGEPTCDSIASIRGKAVEGPTAMLKSAAKLPQNLADGISVLNLTLSKSFVGDALRALVDAYFAMGGIQVQVTCTSIEELKDAMEHPDRHRDLIVRVGGYSDYFVNLSPALRQTVLDRNIHELGEA